MELQNIGASNSDDAFYRYKMPKMITKVEDSGNGIKTNVVNMVDIAKALHRPASYTTKYFGCELGAESMFDEKTGTSLVNGAHDTAKLAGLLETFIKKYVQCYGCGNPETDIIITKTQMITLKCAACGFVSDVDMRDKLTTSILKNPPEQKRSSKDKKGIRRAEKEQLKEGEAADDEQKKVKEIKKKSRGIVSSKDGSKRVSSKIRHAAVRVKKRSSPPESQADNNEVDDNDDDDGVQLQTDTPAEAACQRIQEQLSAVTAEMVILSTDDVTNKDQKRKNHEKKEAAAKVEPEVTVRLSAHEMLILEIKGMLKGSKPCEVGSNLSSLVDSNEEKMNALFEALFEGVGKGFAKEVEKKKTYLAAVVQDEDEGSQMCLLRAIETFCRKCSVDAVKEVALVVKFLYDGDILEEEIIVKWYEEGLVGANKTSPVWKSIKPFVVCLPNAGFGSEEEY